MSTIDYGVADVADLSAHRDRKINVRFDAIISTWDEAPRCEQKTKQGARCTRAADWRTDFHGCARGLMCQHHLDGWKRLVAGAFDGEGAPCVRCGQTFTSIDDAVTVVAL